MTINSKSIYFTGVTLFLKVIFTEGDTKNLVLFIILPDLRQRINEVK